MTVGERIKIQREKLNMTQEELSKKLGLKSRTSISKLETSRELSLKRVSQIASILECSESYLMGWEENANKEKGEKDFELVYKFSKLDDRDKEIVMNMIDSMLKKG